MLRISPHARRTSIEGPDGDAAMKLCAGLPPTDSKVNVEIERFMSDLFGAKDVEAVSVRGIRQAEVDRVLMESVR